MPITIASPAADAGSVAGAPAHVSLRHAVACFAPLTAGNASLDRAVSGPQSRFGSHTMPAADRGVATEGNSRMWRDFLLLAIQSFAIGLVASVLLGLAVFAVGVA